jgi:hypothetical protein
MKTVVPLCVVVLIGALSAEGQDFEARKNQEFEAFLKRHELASRATYRTVAPNRLEGKNVVYRGIVPQAIKSGNPFQLINPFAPVEEGPGAQNLAEPMPGDPVPKLLLVGIEF